jgi:23S rRNA (cytosine1962-C5)-methyltransferase
MNHGSWWIEPSAGAFLEAHGTNAYRIASGEGFWIERYGAAALISTRISRTDHEFLTELIDWSRKTSFACDSVYLRRLVTAPGVDDTPTLLSGNPESPKRIVSENSLRYEIDFSLGYNPGLFTDQRSNRIFLAELSPKRLLNTFAHTCAFSVAAANCGAETLNVDISKSSLGRGRLNFDLNSIDTRGHRFVAEDVPTFLRRLAKRGETFDAIILDPPTFGRGGGGKTFRFERDFEQILTDALAVSSPSASLLLSTNCLAWNEACLESQARKILPPGTRFECAPAQADYPTRVPSVSLWARLP